MHLRACRAKRGAAGREAGLHVSGSTCYSTLRPCFGCLKELYQAGVTGVRYLNAWTPSDPVEAGAYESLLAEMRVHGVTVDPLELPEALLDLRSA